METRIVNEEILFTTQDLTTVSHRDIARLKAQAATTRRGRIRLCAHPSVESAVHEMLIVHPKGAYVRPHKHVKKDESLHLIEGTITVVMFSEDQSVRDVIPMGEYGSGRTFYYRLAGDVYHTLLIDSDVVVFHEATSGPFQKSDMVIAPWAPEEHDLSAVQRFLDDLRERVGAHGDVSHSTRAVGKGAHA